MTYNKYKVSRAFILAALITLMAKTNVSACSQCQFAYFEYIMPPILLWCAIAVVWFFLTAVISTIFRTKLQGIPNIFIAVLLLLVSFAACFIMLGPLSILPFIIPPLMNFISALRNKRRDLSSPFRKTIIILGCFVSLSIIFAMGLGVKTLWKRTDADFVIKWDGTMPAIGIFNKIMDQKPEPIETYRYIVDHSNGSHYSVKKVAERLGAIGDPKKDIPRLYRLLDRSEGSYKYKIQEAIDSLSAKEAISTSNLIK